MPKLVPTIGTCEKLREDALFAVFLLRSAVLDLAAKLLNELESLSVDDRLMYFSENDMLFIGIHEPFLILERLRIGLEVDKIAAVPILRCTKSNLCFFPRK